MGKIFTAILIFSFAVIALSDCNTGTAVVIKITNTSLPNGVVNIAYTVTLEATRGNPPYKWSKISGDLPTSLALNATTGIISGTPKTAGLFTFSIKVEDTAAINSTRTFTIGIGSAAGIVEITTQTLANGRQNTPYSAAVAAKNGVQPYKWSISFSVLPSGLTLNSSTGAITGTPTRTGTFNFTIRVTDAILDKDTSQFSIIISSSPTNPSNGSGGIYPGAQSRTVNVTGLGTQTYYLYLPMSYAPITAIPLVIALHGGAGAGNADSYAQDVRDNWGQVGYAENFMVVAPVATDNATGSWILADTRALLTEIITDVLAAYNIEQEKIYGWGFCAGGGMMHCLGLEKTDFFAAYAVTAGSLDTVARPEGLTPATAARKIPVDLSVGNADPMLQVVKNDRDEFIAAGWVLNTNLYYSEFIGGHTFTIQVLQQVYYNIRKFTLN